MIVIKLNEVSGASARILRAVCKFRREGLCYPFINIEEVHCELSVFVLFVHAWYICV